MAPPQDDLAHRWPVRASGNRRMTFLLERADALLVD
jgi:hypothetical protein